MHTPETFKSALCPPVTFKGALEGPSDLEHFAQEMTKAVNVAIRKAKEDMAVDLDDISSFSGSSSEDECDVRDNDSMLRQSNLFRVVHSGAAGRRVMERESSNEDEFASQELPTRSRQVSRLVAMGFSDVILNDRLLKELNGNLEDVVQRLLEIADSITVGNRVENIGARERRLPLGAKPKSQASRNVPSGDSHLEDVEYSLDAPLKDDFDYILLLSFLESKESGKELIEIICNRYKVSYSAESPNHIKYQIALNCLFNPVIKRHGPGGKSAGKPMIPFTLLDIEGVRDCTMTFVRDGACIVKLVKIRAVLGDEPFSAKCKVCSNCGTCFSGRFLHSRGADIDGSWRSVTKDISGGNGSGSNRNWELLVDHRLCVPCFYRYATKGSLETISRCSIDGIEKLFPKGSILLINSGAVSQYAPKSKKRKLLPSHKMSSNEASNQDATDAVAAKDVASKQALCKVCFEECLGQNIVVCKGCSVAVHKGCYMSEVEEHKPTPRWFCDPCKIGVNARSAECLVCPVRGGALKAVANRGPKDWVHLTCAIWVSELYMEDETTMERVSGVNDIDARELGKLCSICGEYVGCTIQCSEPGCCKRWHPICGMEAGLTMFISTHPTSDVGFSKTALCALHSGKVQSEKHQRDEEAEREQLCICRTPWDGVAFMIQCEKCEIWYHGACVNIQEENVPGMERFVCQRCDAPRARPREPYEAAASEFVSTLAKDTSKTPSTFFGKNPSSARSEPSSFESTADVGGASHKRKRLSPAEARTIYEQRPTGKFGNHSHSADFWKKQASRVAGEFGVTVSVVCDIWLNRRWRKVSSGMRISRIPAASDRSDSDGQSVLGKFLSGFLNSPETSTTHYTTKTFHDLFMNFVRSEGASIPPKLQTVSWFGRHMRTVDGFDLQKSGSLSVCFMDTPVAIQYLKDRKMYFPDFFLHARPKCTASGRFGKNTSPNYLRPQSGLRLVYKWNAYEWYEGTIGKRSSKKNGQKRNNWWNVLWDDGATSLVLLSHATRSKWYVYTLDGPKPAIYETLPIVSSNRIVEVLEECIVREAGQRESLTTSHAQSLIEIDSDSMEQPADGSAHKPDGERAQAKRQSVGDSAGTQFFDEEIDS